jgi:hypothetical protein
MRIVVRFIIVLCMGTICSMAQQAELRPAPNGRWADSLTATSPVGQTLLAVREVSLEGQYPDGRPVKSGLLILFDPVSHYFAWEQALGWERPSGFRKGLLAASAAGDRMTVFRVLPGSEMIYVQESTEKAHTLDDAEAKAIEAARRRLGTPQSRQWYGWREVSLIKWLERNFFIPRYSAAPSFPIEILSVASRDGKWEVVLKAQWKERITMNDKYEVLTTTRVP